MPAAGYSVTAHGVGSVVEALGQGFHHGGVAVALLRGLDVERGGAAVRPLGIAAHEGVALKAALELLDVNLEHGQIVASAVGHEAGAAVAVEPVAEGGGQALIQRGGPQVVAGEVEAVGVGSARMICTAVWPLLWPAGGTKALSGRLKYWVAGAEAQAASSRAVAAADSLANKDISGFLSGWDR